MKKQSLTFLGTGTSQGIPVVACTCGVCQSGDYRDKRLRSSVLVNISGKNILIDCGPDFRQQMLREKIDHLDGILLTHEHYDHISGLDDIRAYNWIQQKPMDIYCETRVQKSIKQIFSYVFAAKKYPGIPQMQLHDVVNKPFFIEDIQIVPIRAMHYKLPVFGYRISNFAYLTDVKTIAKNELDKLQGLSVLVINALRFEDHISHLTLEEALAIIDDLKPKKAYLTHLSHLLGKHEIIQQQLPKNVELSYDLLTIEFD